MIATVNPGLQSNKYKKAIIGIADRSRDGNAKKYSNKRGRDDNTTSISTSHTHTHTLCSSTRIEMLCCVTCVCVM